MPVPVWIVLGMLALVGLYAYVYSFLFHRANYIRQPEFFVRHNPDKNLLIFVIPGWGQDGNAVGHAFMDAGLSRIATVARLSYAHRGFSIQAIYDEMMGVLDEYQPTYWTAIGGSMGGM